MKNWLDMEILISSIFVQPNIKFRDWLKDECPVDALRACFYLLIVYFKKQRRVSEKITL